MSESLTPLDRAFDACNALEKTVGEMRFLTVAIAEVIEDDDLSKGCNSLLYRITNDLDRLASDFWGLLRFLPKPSTETPNPRPPLNPEEIAIKVQVEALADRLKEIQEERQALPVNPEEVRANV